MPMTIAMLTDFGHSDPYVGQIKGVFANLVPGAHVVDLCHEIVPYGISQAAFFLQASWSHFPRATLFMAVVDPGVGSDRRIVCLVKHRQIFLAPDNGLLGLLLEDHSFDANEEVQRAYDLTPAADQAEQAADRNHTFDGRDIFAPLAAHIALGEEPQMLGPEIDPATLKREPWAAADITDNALHAHVLHVDRFGNAILNVPETFATTFAAQHGGQSLDQWAEKGIHIDLPHAPPLHVATHYHQIKANEVGLIPGSQGFLELGMNMLSAARTLRLHPGNPVTILRTT